MTKNWSAKKGGGRYDYLKDELMHDTGSTIPLTVANPNLVTNIRVSKQPLVMATNAGTKKLDLEADIEGFGTAWYHEDQLANILAKKHRIQVDNLYPCNNEENAFKVHIDTGNKEFRIANEGLCTHKPSEKYLKPGAEQKNIAPKKT
jgi:hypothetical protein